MELKIGQRWMWNYPDHRMIVEMNSIDKGLVIKAEGDNAYHLGKQQLVSPTNSRWVLLEGQDKPQE